ncbi:MAG: hypothetical protein CM1200mP10_33380 [Candidatus Neomarinimicrobiota bacterium]|nr:MAG: hypothetical protein CM1200mP10_33380 [Candidatus Neomarinimicrobiota bacterium]
MMRKGLNAEGIILEGLNGKELPTALNKIIMMEMDNCLKEFLLLVNAWRININ